MAKIEEYDAGDLTEWQDEDQEGQDGEPGIPGSSNKGKGKKSDQKPKPGKGKGGDGDVSDEDIDDVSEEDIDNANKENGKNVASKKESSKEDVDKEKAKGQAASKAKKGGRGASGKDKERGDFDYTQIQPTYTWERLLSKLVKNSSDLTDESYQKPSPKSATSAHTMAQTGSAAVKPGEIKMEDEIKLCIVVDSSGSMSSALAKIYANLNALLKGGGNLGSALFLIKFSNDYTVYKINLKNQQVAEVKSLKDKAKMEHGNVSTLFSRTFGGATNFTSPLTASIEEFHKAKYNVLIISDSDIASGQNANEIKKLYKSMKQSLYIIAADHNSFVALCKTFQEVSKNISVFS